MSPHLRAANSNPKSMTTVSTASDVQNPRALRIFIVGKNRAELCVAVRVTSGSILEGDCTPGSTSQPRNWRPFCACSASTPVLQYVHSQSLPALLEETAAPPSYAAFREFLGKNPDEPDNV